MPKEDFIWRGEEIVVKENSFANSLVDGLNDVFQNGFKQTAVDKEILSEFKYLSQTYITASSTKCSAIGQDNELLSAGTYGYIYLVKAEQIQLASLQKGSYAITPEIDSSLIVGAMPSAFVAFALGINEQSFITNPQYQEDELNEDLKKRLGIVNCIVSDNFSKKYFKDTLETIYNRYLHTDVVTEFFKQNHASRLSQALPPALHP